MHPSLKPAHGRFIWFQKELGFPRRQRKWSEYLYQLQKRRRKHNCRNSTGKKGLVPSQDTARKPKCENGRGRKRAQSTEKLQIQGWYVQNPPEELREESSASAKTSWRSARSHGPRPEALPCRFPGPRRLQGQHWGRRGTGPRRGRSVEAKFSIVSTHSSRKASSQVPPRTELPEDSGVSRASAPVRRLRVSVPAAMGVTGPWRPQGCTAGRHTGSARIFGDSSSGKQQPAGAPASAETPQLNKDLPSQSKMRARGSCVCHAP